MASFPWLPLMVAAAILFACDHTHASSYTTYMTIRYYTDGNMICDHPQVNLTQRTDVQALTWIFPNGMLVNPRTYLDPKLYKLKDLSDDITPSSLRERYDGYNLTALEVSDDAFGYYTCVVVLTPSINQDPPIIAIRWGLNVDGADFSALIEDYKQNAIIGGIAAAVAVGIIAAIALVWYFKCQDNFSEDLEDNRVVEEDLSGKPEIDPAVYYANSAYSGDGAGSEPKTKAAINGDDTSRL